MSACELVAFTGAEASLVARLAMRVAEAASALWGDVVGVMRLVDRDTYGPSYTAHGVVHVRFAWTPEATVESLRRAAFAARAGSVVLVADHPAAMALAARAADRVVRVGAGDHPVARRGASELAVELVAHEHALPRPWPDLDARTFLARGLVASLTARGSQHTAAMPSPGDPARATLQRDTALTDYDSPFARLAPASRDRVARLARAVTRRRVGVAIGGAGAWGYTGVALMLALLDRGVPIDLVAGSSSGALAGAYYCARGADGLARLIARGPSFRRAMALMACSSQPAAWAVDSDLDGARIEALEALFLPVTTSLTRMRAEVVSAGSVGFGVRASCAAPGVFAPTMADDGSLLVDGAVSDNAPVALVEATGADLAVVSNPLPGPRPTSRARWPLVGRLGDLGAAFAMLLHGAGDREAHARRVVWSVDPADAPLRRTFRYDHAAQIVAEARRDPRLAATVDVVVAAWSDLCLPRTPSLDALTVTEPRP